MSIYIKFIFSIDMCTSSSIIVIVTVAVAVVLISVLETIRSFFIHSFSHFLSLLRLLNQPINQSVVVS